MNPGAAVTSVQVLPSGRTPYITGWSLKELNQPPRIHSLSLKTNSLRIRGFHAAADVSFTQFGRTFTSAERLSQPEEE